jgi:hypothetical protein
MVIRKYAALPIIVLLALLFAGLADAFVVEYYGTCWPNATNVTVYNQTGAVVAFQEFSNSPPTSGCWGPGLYSIEIPDTLVQPDTYLAFFLNDMAAGSDFFNYTDLENIELNLSDIQSPNITLIYPADNATVGPSFNFTYNVTDHSGIANCSLLINDVINQTDTTVTTGINQFFPVVLPEGDYNWSVICYDNGPNNVFGQSARWLVHVRDDGILNCTLYIPSADTNVKEFSFFNFTIRVECLDGNCGAVTAALDPVSHGKAWWQLLIEWILSLQWLINPSTGWAAGGLIPSGAGTPWYTLNQTTQSAGIMTANDTVYITWAVHANASAPVTSEFFAICNSSRYPDVLANETSRINISIVNNTAPSIDGVNITDPACSDSIIYCLPINASDADNDTVSFYYTWYFDNIEYPGVTASTLDCGTESGCDKNVNVTCKITPFDSDLNGTAFNDTVNISDCPPYLNIPDICIETDSWYSLNLSLYALDPDNDTISWVNWTNGTNVTVDVNLTTTIANFTPDTGFVGMDYVNFTASDGNSNSTQQVMVRVIPGGGAAVSSFYQEPIHAYRNDSIYAYCNNSYGLMPEIDYRINSGTWYNTTSVYSNSTWVSTIKTNYSDFWLGIYDFRCRVADCNGSGLYSYDYGSVQVFNNKPSATLSLNPSPAYRSQNLTITANCTVNDAEDSPAQIDVDMKYEYAGAPGWHDCAEIRIGSSWFCSIPCGLDDWYLGALNVKCSATDSDAGLATAEASVNILNNIPSIDLPNNKTIPAIYYVQILYLEDYASDVEDDGILNFTILNQTNTSVAECSIDYPTDLVYCMPNRNVSGETNLTIEVEDTEGAKSNDTIRIITENPYLVSISFNNSFLIGDNVTCTARVQINYDNITSPDHVFANIYDTNGTIDYVSGNVKASCTGINWSTGKDCEVRVNNIYGTKGLWQCQFFVGDKFEGFDNFDMLIANGTMFNTPPSIDVGYRYGVVGRTDSFYVPASDPNPEDALTYGTNLSVGSLNTATGFFSITPSIGQVGNYIANWTVLDGSAIAWDIQPFDVWRYDCSNISVLYYGNCSPDGNIDVYVNGKLVAHESYNPQGCFNSQYEIIVDNAGPEPECSIWLNDTVEFYVKGLLAGSDNWTYTNDSVVGLNLFAGNVTPTTMPTTTTTIRKGGGGGRGAGIAVCIPEWNCTPWGPCIDGVQTRECRDMQACNILDLNVPPEIQACTVLCENKIKDFDETDVDCGGACGSTCTDGKMCIIDNDCISRHCENGRCVSCYDGLRNQGEEGIDCGGSYCGACQIPAPVLCTDRVSSWHITLLLVVLVITIFYADKYYRQFLEKKSRPVPKWLDFVKQDPAANIIAMIIFALIALFGLIFDSACFEQCLIFKSKHLLAIVSLLMIALFGYRLYRMKSKMGLIVFEFDKWVKVILGVMVLLVIVIAVLAHIYFTDSCGTCFDGKQNQGELGIDCGGPCRECAQQAIVVQTSPVTFMLPLLVVLIIIGGIASYIMFRENLPFKAGPEIPAPPEPVAPAEQEIKPVTAIPPQKVAPKISPKPAIREPVFKEIEGIPGELRKLTDELENLFAKAYSALERSDFEDGQRIASILARKYRKLPHNMREIAYNKIMDLYNRIEKKIL